MDYFSAPVLHQRMRGTDRPDTGAPIGQPVVGVTANAASVVEGGTISMRIDRTVITNGEISYSWLFASEGGDADFSTPPSGTRTLANGQVLDTISVVTVQRTGTQGTRRVTCTITAVVNGVIDPVHSSASTDILDFVVALTSGWHKQLAYRSGRPLAQGVSFFNRNNETWEFYEEEVAYIDAYSGGSAGSGSSRVATAALMFGGPKGNPGSISTTGQLNWNTATDTDFAGYFPNVPVNTCWVNWSFTIVPLSADTTASVAARTAWWDAINAGTYDQEFKDMGGRIARNCIARGQSMDFLLLRHNRDNDQDVHHRVFSTAKNQYKSAAARAFDLIREGADFNLRILFSPGPFKDFAGGTGDMGTLVSWCPSNVDGISMTFKPNSGVTNKTTYLTRIHGNSSLYGLEDDVLNLCRIKGWKVAFSEWGPSVSSCPIADDVYTWFYDEYLIPHREDIICECVFDSKTLMPEAAASAGQGATGAQNWRDGVVVFKDKYRGKKPTDTGFTRPTWPATLTPAYEIVQPPIPLGPSRAKPPAPPNGFFFRPTAASLDIDGSNTANVAAHKSYDYQLRDFTQHAVGQGDVNSIVFDAKQSSSIVGGRIYTFNPAYFTTTWRQLLVSPRDWGFGRGIDVHSTAGDAFVEGWDLRDCVLAIYYYNTIPLTDKIYHRCMFMFRSRHTSITNDTQRTLSLDNVYCSGHSIFSQLAAAGVANTRVITLIKNCIFHLERLPYDTFDGTALPAPGSKRVGPYTGPGSPNEGIVTGPTAGYAHDWWVISNVLSGGLYYFRCYMRDTLIRIDTIPVTSAGNAYFPPIGDGVGSGSQNGSYYERVTVLWFGGGTWDSAGFPQTKANLFSMGITVVDDEAAAWAIWNTTYGNFLNENGYSSTTGRFTWNIAALGDEPEPEDPDVPEEDDASGTTPTGWPYPQTTLWEQLSWSSIKRWYENADQLPVSERSDGALIFVGADEEGWLDNQTKSAWRAVAVTGSNPLTNLVGTNLGNRGDITTAKPQGVICLPDDVVVVFYSYEEANPTDDGGHTYVAISTDNGATFDHNGGAGEHIFNTNATPSLIICGVLQQRAGYLSMPDNKFVDLDHVYVYLNNRQQANVDDYDDFPGGSPIYMARCKFQGGSDTVANLKTANKWQLFTGLDNDGIPTWGTNTTSNRQSVFADSNGLGLYFQVFWHDALERYVACYAHCHHGTGANFKPQALAMLTNKYPWKKTGWRTICYDKLAPTTASETGYYFDCCAPNRWNDGDDIYIGVNTYVNEPEGTFGGAGDNLIVTKGKIVRTGGPAKRPYTLPADPEQTRNGYGGTTYYVSPNGSGSGKTDEDNPGNLKATMEALNDNNQVVMLPGNYGAQTITCKSGTNGKILLRAKNNCFADVDLSSFSGGMTGYNEANAALHTVFTGIVTFHGYKQLWLEGVRCGDKDPTTANNNTTNGAIAIGAGSTSTIGYNWITKCYFKNCQSTMILVGTKMRIMIFRNYFICNKRVVTVTPERTFTDWVPDYHIRFQEDLTDGWAVENFHRGGYNQCVSFKEKNNNGHMLGSVYDSSLRVQAPGGTSSTGGTTIFLGQTADHTVDNDEDDTCRSIEVAYNKFFRLDGNCNIHISNVEIANCHHNEHSGTGGTYSVYKFYTHSVVSGNLNVVLDTLFGHPHTWDVHHETFHTPSIMEMIFGRTRINENVRRTTITIRDNTSSANLVSKFNDTTDQIFRANTPAYPDFDNNARLLVTLGTNAKVAKVAGNDPDTEIQYT